MGYYTGNGVVTGGGSSVSVALNLGVHNWYQRTNTKVTAFGGVSLSTAERYSSSSSFSQCSQVVGTAMFRIANGKGTSTDYSYYQISGSNLYELIKTEKTISARLDNHLWQTP